VGTGNVPLLAAAHQVLPGEKPSPLPHYRHEPPPIGSSSIRCRFADPFKNGSSIPVRRRLARRRTWGRKAYLLSTFRAPSLRTTLRFVFPPLCPPARRPQSRLEAPQTRFGHCAGRGVRPALVRPQPHRPRLPPSPDSSRAPRWPRLGSPFNFSAATSSSRRLQILDQGLGPRRR